VDLTAAGRQVLREHEARRAEAELLPVTLTRNPLHGDLHNPAEPIRGLRRRPGGAEIRPGDVVADSSGHEAVYVGPTMSSDDGGVTWAPGSTPACDMTSSANTL
jgi:hypothetical protein